MSRTGNDIELKPFSSTTYFSGISCAAFFIFAHIKDKKYMETIIGLFFLLKCTITKTAKQHSVKYVI